MTDLRTLADRDCIGIVIVDHGSHRAESNRRHEDFVAEWKLRSGYTIVEAAHMELAEPSIGTAFDACVAAGATTIVVAPYLLWPGNHWERDIPALATEASTSAVQPAVSDDRRRETQARYTDAARTNRDRVRAAGPSPAQSASNVSVVCRGDRFTRSVVTGS